MTLLSLSHSPRLRAVLRPAFACAGLAALLAGCAQQPVHRQHSSEYFSEKVYGRASPRVVGEGQPIPRGGGKYLVGHPYTVAGRTYYPHEIRGRFTQVGMASWYGDAFNGRRTANGEIYDKNGLTAAHPTMPLPSYARVTDMQNGRSIIVRVNDRGPYHSGRVMDVSARVAAALDFKRYGTAKIKVDYIGPAPLAGSDDRMLMATLRTDGTPATLNGLPGGPPVMVADNEKREKLRREPTSQTPFRVAEADIGSPLVAIQSARMPAVAPIPPSRPFDLGTIPGADRPIRLRHRHQAALFYLEPPLPPEHDPFGRLDLSSGRGLHRR